MNKPGIPSKEEQISHIMQTFDFQRVADAMEKLEWKWYNTPNGVTAQNLKEAALSLLDGVDKKTWSTGCGGLLAMYRKGFYSLLFVIDESWGQDADY